jgi:hypothetical protein|tara:strand:+ start:229 stop:3714 length:3486 start_codon:yes stop_codon:yes gene_type:complete
MATIQDQMDSLYLKRIQNIKLPEEDQQESSIFSVLGVKGVEETVAEYSEKDAIAYAGSMGLQDTFRGIKQITGWGDQDQDFDQRVLNKLMEHPEWGGKVKASWMAGMLLDPAGWLVPVAKVRTFGKLAWHGAKWGAASGALGYVDGDRSADRLLQAAGGAVGGAVLAPAFGIGGRKALAAIRGQKGETVSDFANSKTTQELLDNPEDTVKQFTGSKMSTLNSSIKKFYTSPFQSGKEKYYEYTEKFLHKPVFDNPVPSMAGTAGFVGAQQTVDYLENERDLDIGPLTQAMISILAGGGLALGMKKTKWGTQASDFFGRRVIENYKLSPEFVKLKEDAGFAFHSIENQFMDISRRAAGLGEDESRILYQFLDGQERNIAGKVSKEVHELGLEAQKLIRDTGEHMVHAGILKAEDWNRGLDSYIHRTYLKPLMVKKMSKREQQIIKDSIKENIGILGNELKARGNLREFNLKADGGGPESTTNDIADFRSKGWVDFRGDTGDGQIILRKDYTPAQRKAMGEIEDAGFAIMSTGKLMLNDLAVYKLYRDTAAKHAKEYKDYKKLSKKEKAELVQVSSAYLEGTGKELRKFGALAGKWLPKDIAEDIQVARAYQDKNNVMTTIYNSPGMRRYRKYNSMWKRTKTSWNPTVHANNLISNFVLMDLHDIQGKHLLTGLNVWSEAGQKRLMKHTILGEEMNVYDDLVSFNVFDASLAKTELGLGQRELSRLYEKKLNIDIKDVDAIIEASSDISGTIWQKIKLPLKGLKRGISVADTKVTNIYQMEDQMFRIAMYLDRLEKGMPALKSLKKGSAAYNKKLQELKQSSAMAAKKGFIDYNIQAPWVQIARDTAVPFIAYTYGIIPILAKTATTKPHKFAKWAAIGYAINYAGQEQSKESEASERAIFQEREKSDIFGLPFMPPSFLKLPDSWNRAFTFGEDRDPITGKHIPDRSLYLDTTRWIPGGDVLGQTSETGRLIPFLPAPFQPSFGLAGEVFLPLVFGIDPFTMKQDERDTFSLENSLFMLKRLVPNNPLIGISGVQKLLGFDSRFDMFDSWSMKKIMKALEHKEDASDYTEDLPVLMAIAQTIGIKLWPVEREVALKGFTQEQQKRTKKLRKNLYKMRREMEKYPSGTPEYWEKYKEVKEELEDVIREEIRVNSKILKARRTK